MQWPPRPGPGLKRHEPERLRRRRLHDLPDVDVHPVAELRELVDERDVDRAEDVLEQLRQLGGLGRRDGVTIVSIAAGRPRRRPRRGLVDPADDLRRRLRRPVGPPGVDALGGEGEQEVLAGDETAALLEDRRRESRASCPDTWSTRARRRDPRAGAAPACVRRPRRTRDPARAAARAASARRSGSRPRRPDVEVGGRGSPRSRRAAAGAPWGRP